MKFGKFLLSLAVVCFLTANISKVAHGSWPAPAWADLPELEYIYDSGDIIWFYSTLDAVVFAPRYVITYEKSTNNVKFHPVSTRKIPGDAPTNFQESKQSPPYLRVEPHEITLKETRIAMPELTSEEAERLRKWSAYMQRNRRLPLSKFTLNNALQGSFIEVDGSYYFGMKGGIAEGVGHLGGLVVYQPSDGKVTILRSKYLVDCSVTGIIRIGAELAVSTIYRGEYFFGPGLYWEDGKEHRVGLVLYNTSTGKWKHIPTENLGIIIREMSVIDDSIWMTTNWGISCYRPNTDRMRNWCWSLSLVEK